MTVRKALATMLVVLALPGCAQLTAEAPLFSPADQLGEPPITEGLWISVSDECPARFTRARGRFPAACLPFEIRRTTDGAWRITARVDLTYGLSAEERAQAEQEFGLDRLVIVPAVERTVAQGEYVPLYVAEFEHPEERSIMYVLVSPVGPMPATELSGLLSIGCDSILRDGPIEGITMRTRTTADGEQTDCVASTQAAVREAARREAIESLDGLRQPGYVFVRAN